MSIPSGNISLPADFIGASLPTARNFSLVRMTEAAALPRVLLLGQGLPATPNPPTAARPWPPAENDGSTVDTNYQAGCSYTVGGVATGSSGNRKAAALVRCGAGGYTSAFVMDWKPGAYNLPPCSVVEVAVMPWGASWNGTLGFSFSAAIVNGSMEGAHVPTQTAQIIFPGADTYTLSVPARARAVDVIMADQSLVQVSLSNVAGSKPTPFVMRDQTSLLAPVFSPPWGPVEIGPSQDTVQLVASGACRVTVQWFLQP